MSAILQVKNIEKTYRRGLRKVHAVRDISFDIFPGECVGLVGESGCGKTSLLNLITGLEKYDAGTMAFLGKTYEDKMKIPDCDIQMIFQNPLSSFNPKLRLEKSLTEGFLNRGISFQSAKIQAQHYLTLCGLDPIFMNRYPHQMSGGECQRASIARALAQKPRLLVCDEPTSALDVTTQSRIVTLLEKLKNQTKMAMLFVTHDIALALNFCDRILVMYEGQIIEQGTPSQIIKSPKAPYTQKLMDSVMEIF